MCGNTEYLIYYVYDETGLPIGLKYRTSAYEAGVFDCFFFEKNLQGILSRFIIALENELAPIPMTLGEISIIHSPAEIQRWRIGLCFV